MGPIAEIVIRLVSLLAGLPVSSRRLARERDPGPEPDIPSQPLYSVAAAACGLTELQRLGWRGRRTVKGRSGDLRVRLEQGTRTNEEGETEPETRVFVDRSGGHPLPIALYHERQFFLGRDLSAREIEIGDKPFDDDFYVTGPHTFVRALLDGRMRRLLRTLLLEMEMEVTPSEVRGRLPATTSWPMHDRKLGHMLGLMLDVARHFERPRDVVGRLAENARVDPVPEVRLQNLLTLIREYPEEPATEETLLSACSDASNWIRVRAATALGERGRPTLLEIAELDPPDETATPQAIVMLGRALPPERVREILGRALRNREQGTARACLAVLGQGGGGEFISLMAKVMSVERGDLAVAAADALAATGSPAAEPALLAALERDVPELRVAAARALGRVGSAAAIVHLKEAEAEAKATDLSRAVRQAIAEIQARLPGASPGQLSIASAESGALSIVEDERGRLSLPVPGEQK